MRDLSRNVVAAWNHGVRSLNSLGREGDWIKFFKVQFYTLRTSLMLPPNMKRPHFSRLLIPKKKQIAGSLYLLKLIVSRSLATFLFTGIESFWFFYYISSLSSTLFLTITLNVILKTAMSFSFTAFFIYEQYELELYHIARIFVECLTVVKEGVLKNLPLPNASSKPMFMWKLPSPGDNLRD